MDWQIGDDLADWSGIDIGMADWSWIDIRLAAGTDGLTLDCRSDGSMGWYRIDIGLGWIGDGLASHGNRMSWRRTGDRLAQD